eukprot:4577158-Pyramimonas_sp.AAC.1
MQAACAVPPAPNCWASRRDARCCSPCPKYGVLVIGRPRQRNLLLLTSSPSAPVTHHSDLLITQTHSSLRLTPHSVSLIARTES